MRVLRYLRRQIERVPPYPALALIAVPLAVAEPLKLATLFIIGKGHWITGVVAMICAYAVSLFVTERLFLSRNFSSCDGSRRSGVVQRGPRQGVAVRDKAFDDSRQPASR